MSEIEDQLAITDVLSMYAFLADTDQFSRIPDEVFAADAVLDWGVGEVSGRDALRSWFDRPRPGLLGTSHMITNVMVRIAGDRAEALSTRVAWHWFEDGAGMGALQEANVVLVGGYQDELRREPECWRVSHRRAHQFGPGVGIGPNLPPMIKTLVSAASGRVPTW